MRIYRSDLDGEQPAAAQENGAKAPRSESAVQAGTWALRMAAYGAVTIGLTLFLMRPAGSSAAGAAGTGPGGSRASLNLGSGVIGLAFKTGSLLSPQEETKAPASTKAASSAPAPRPAVKQNPAPPASKKPTAKRNKPAKGTIQWSGPGVVAGTQPAQAAKLQPATISGDKNPFARQPAAAAAAENDTRPPAPQPSPESRSAVAQAPAASPAPAATARAGAPVQQVRLGSRYHDPADRYSMQFPVGWTYRPVNDGGGSWVLDATDGRSAVISIGFAPFPANIKTEQVSPGRVATALRSRPGTVVHAGGFARVAGRKCLWHKYTGPIPRNDGTPRMTAVHYLLPLGDGRALELRVAAAPEKFNQLAPWMKRSVNSFRLATPQKPVRVASSQRKSA